jgi:hypothetical protein
MEELSLEAERTNCMMTGVCADRPDCVNVRSRAQRAFDSRFGARPGHLLVNRTIGKKGSFDMPIDVPRARGDCQTWASARLR